MHEEGIDAVYMFIEKAGIRLQVNEVLLECLEDGNTTSFQNLIEELILVGPESLRIVREILKEVDLMLEQFQQKLNESTRDGVVRGNYITPQISEKTIHNIIIMKEIQAYLNDWLWGLIYLSTRHEWAQAYAIKTKNKWLL